MTFPAIKPLHTRIFFKFIEDLTNTSFMPKSSGGIFLTDVYDFSEVHRPHWGKVEVCGKDVCDEIKNATYILIEPGKWTTRINMTNEEPFWQTEEAFVMMTSDDISVTARY